MNVPTSCVRRAQLADVEQLLRTASSQGPDRPCFLSLVSVWGRLAALPCTEPCGDSLCQVEGKQCN